MKMQVITRWCEFLVAAFGPFAAGNAITVQANVQQTQTGVAQAASLAAGGTCGVVITQMCCTIRKSYW